MSSDGYAVTGSSFVTPVEYKRIPTHTSFAFRRPTSRVSKWYCNPLDGTVLQDNMLPDNAKDVTDRVKAVSQSVPGQISVPYNTAADDTKC